MTYVPLPPPVPDGAVGAGSEVPAVQLLTAAGERVAHPAYDPRVADLTAADLRSLYRDMVLARRFDVEATALQRQGELGLWAPMLGQEAAQVGSARALRPGERVFPSYREHAVGLCRGVDPLQILGLFRGTTAGGWDPAETGMGLYSIVVGTQALHATGYAMGIQMDGADEATIAYFGDGATAQGDINEAFVWASVTQAPVVFFVQNNQWAISAPVSTQSRVPLFRRAAGFGFPGVQVDGNDVLATLAVTRAALDDARSGQGPTLIEAVTYRMGHHTTSDDSGRYRSDAEIESWRARDPIARLRTWLWHEAVLDDDVEDGLAAESERLAERVRHGCRELPDPAPTTIFDHVYQRETALLARQRALLEAELAYGTGR